MIVDWKIFETFKDQNKDLVNCEYSIVRAYLNKERGAKCEVLVEICPLIIKEINDSENIQVEMDLNNAQIDSLAFESRKDCQIDTVL